ncbi:MAG: PTS system mannose/fructose/sorbose family transporter subunit IID [Erysipelotrichaceae bacterium]|nr:PTS system mannose/fructose/sorbose family transporter subunit IID [Erysipelotrichaceae bacterium]
MVVGTGVYKDTNEAYPLDKKILGKVALRSLFAGASTNGETAESIGWAWALAPALKKIHTDEEDLALSMGHHLEYVNAASPLTTFTMGVVLSLEVQKADPETIRSVRTALASAVDGLGNSLFRFILVPLLAMICIALSANGNVTGAVLMAVCSAVVTIALRMYLINFGYAKGVRAAESFMKNADALKHASSVAGVFMLGAMTVISFYEISSAFTVPAAGNIRTLSGFGELVLPGMLGLIAVALAYRLLVKKNRSPFVTVIIFAVIAVLLVVLGFAGDYPSILNLPWVIKG